MLSLSPAALALPVDVPTLPTVSPLKNARVIIDAHRYRNDPYNCRVLPPIKQTPVSVQIDAAAAPLEELPLRETFPPRLGKAKSVVVNAAQQFTNEFEGFAFVRFKHESCLYTTPFPVAVGDLVAVQGDRGFNIGTVSKIAGRPSYPVPCAILRHADRNECDLYETQSEDEGAALDLVRGVVIQLRIPMEVVDVELQTDRNKLTIYYASRRLIDFRRLQRTLFQKFRCRIWLVNWKDMMHRDDVDTF